MLAYKDIKLNNPYRASEHVIEILNLVKHEIIFYVGALNSCTFYYYFDEEEVDIVITSEGKKIKEESRSINLTNNILNLTSIDFNFYITFTKKEFFKIYLDYCDYFYNSSTIIKDQGSVNIDIEFTGSIDNFLEIEEFILLKLAESTQYACNRLINNKKIECSYFADIDASIEYIRMYAYLKKCSIEESLQHVGYKDEKQKEHLIKLSRKIKKIKC